MRPLIHKKTHQSLLILCSSAIYAFGAPASSTLPSSTEILATATLVNDYWIANNNLGDAQWSNATYYTGNQRLYEITGNSAYLTRSLDWAVSNNWLRSEKPWKYSTQAENDEDADNHCCGQTYIDLYEIDPQAVRIADIVRANDYLVGESDTDYWSWIDTFYMHGPTFAKLAITTGDSDYTDKMWAMYTDTKTTQNLFDADEGLWYRDSKYIFGNGNPRSTSSNGNKVFWARGNGWMLGGLTRVVDALPAGYANRNAYISMIQTMAAALVPLQQSDGFWRSSLLEPTQFDMPETSGTAFYAYSMAWGINNGILDKATYLPVVAKAWNGMVAEAVHPNGFLGYVQLVAAEPGESFYADTKAYGVGAFLLAASELSILAENSIAPDAGPSHTLYDFDSTGNATVTLDGSGTNDPEDEALTYEWLLGGNTIATGITAYATLPVGVHDITLRITDENSTIWEDVVQVTIAEPVTGQLYIEDFDNPTGDAPLSNYGWSVLVTENGVISTYAGESRAIGAASGDYGFYAPRVDNGPPWNDAVPNNPALASTALTSPISIRALTAINWLASGDNADHEYRVAIKVGGVWYASNPALNDGEPDSGTAVDNPLSFTPASFATATNWLTVQNTTLGAPGSLSLGTIPAGDLVGDVTDVGFYLVSGVNNDPGDHIRFDDFEITGQVTAEPLPTVASFSTVDTINSDSWELLIQGEADTTYVFYSASDLNFNPGARVRTLSQENPMSDPGVVTDGSRLTTDSNGNAKVRMTLNGAPSDFVRIQMAP